MKKVFTLICFHLMFVAAWAQQAPNLPATFYHNKSVDANTIDQIKSLNGPIDRATTEQFIIDYDFTDETYAMANFFDYNRFVWEVNRDFVQGDVGTLRWSAVGFDRLITETGIEIPRDAATMTVDSIGIVMSHLNNSGNTDTVIVTMVSFNFAIPANPTFQNNIIWADTLTTDTSLSTTIQANGLPAAFELVLAPDITLNQGQTFGVRVDFIGDTATSEFYVLHGYRDECSALCGASEALVGENTWAFGNWGSFSGINTVVINTANCDMQSAMDCPLYFLQNMLIRAWVTADVEFNAIVNAPTTEGCGGEVIQLDVSSSGGVEPLTYSWSPGIGLSDSTISNPQHVVGDNDVTYTVTVIDANMDTTMSDITINSNAIDVSVADANITCGGSATLTAIPSGSTGGITYEWNTGGMSFVEGVTTAGTYSITVTNVDGCTATDNASVTLTGVGQMVDFSYPDPVCQDATVQFSNASSVQNNWVFTWFFGDGDSIVGTTAAHAYSSSGNFIAMLAADSANCSLSTSQTVVVLPLNNTQCVSGIEVLPFSESITISPIPALDVLNIRIDEVSGEDLNMIIYDINGQEMFSSRYEQITTLNDAVDVSQYASGIYYVQFESQGRVSVKKFAVTK